MIVGLYHHCPVREKMLSIIFSGYIHAAVNYYRSRKPSLQKLLEIFPNVGHRNPETYTHACVIRGCGLECNRRAWEAYDGGCVGSIAQMPKKDHFPSTYVGDPGAPPPS